VVAEHLAVGAELFVPGDAIRAASAGDQVVQAHTIADAVGGDTWAECGHDTGDFVAKGARE
jgi:hypothetical protein